MCGRRSQWVREKGKPHGEAGLIMGLLSIGVAGVGGSRARK